MDILQAADPGSVFGFSVLSLAVLAALVVLMVLGILMPWFVWRVSVHARDLRDIARRMASDLETVRREVRAIANATTGAEPPL